MEILRHLKGKSGYTLLELLVVLALFAIVLSIGIPSARVLFRVREKDELKTFKRDIMHIRTSAIVDNCEYRLTLDADKNSYMLSKVEEKAKNIKTVCFEHGIVLGKYQDAYTISFYSTGAPNKGTTIRLTNSKGEKVEIAITPATGSVNLKINKSGS